MAGSEPAASNGTITKLPPIPKGFKIQKRPLTRRQLPASSKSRIIYISSSTPFMSAVKRIRKQLDQSLHRDAAPKNASLQSRVEALQRQQDSAERDGKATVVTAMGTGRAVEKTLSVAGWFEQQGDCEVEIRTRTVGTVDDVVDERQEEGGVEDESRVRKLSCLEVRVRMK